MNKYTKALAKLKKEYDAYLIDNKYGKGTHNEEFKTLFELKGENVANALSWIKRNYDCYYEDEIDVTDETDPFGYLLRLAIMEGEDDGKTD